LAFHPYPQLIPNFFNSYGFGPPLGVTRASSWPWVDRFGFGSSATNCPGSFRCHHALFRLAFASAPRLKRLTSLVTTNSPDHNAKGTQSGPCMHQNAHTPLLPLVGTRFQDLFHSPPGVLFTFPSRYWFTIGHERVFSLGGWSPQIPTGFLVPRRTQVPGSSMQPEFRLRGSHPLPRSVPTRFGYPAVTDGTMPHPGPTTPIPKNRFGLFPFRSPLLRESHLISLPQAT
jgi:hypothetical protein